MTPFVNPTPAIHAEPRLGDVGAVMAQLEQALAQQFERQEAHRRWENEAFRLTTLELAKRIPQPPRVLRLLNGEDDDLLAHALRLTGKRNAEAILAAVRSGRPYRAFHDAVARVEGLTEGRVLKLIDFLEGQLPLKPEAFRPSARA